MPTLERVKAFIRTVEAGMYVDAIEKFYTAHASMAENITPPRNGRERLVKHENMVLAAHKAIRCQCLEPPLVAENSVAIRWRFDFEYHDGSSKTLEEIAWQRWEGDRIAEERFIYDPSQMAS
jgi:hypothetical protein